MVDFATSWYRLVEKIFLKEMDHTTIIPQLKKITNENEWLYQILFLSPHIERFIKSQLISSKIAYQYYIWNPEQLDRLVVSCGNEAINLINQILLGLDREQRIHLLFYYLSSVLRDTADMKGLLCLNDAYKSDLRDAFFLRFILSLEFLRFESNEEMLPFLEFYVNEFGFLDLLKEIIKYFGDYFPYSSLFELFYPFHQSILQEVLNAMDHAINSRAIGTQEDKIGPMLGYFNSALWILRNREYCTKHSHFEAVVEYKKISEKWNYFSGFFLITVQTNREYSLQGIEVPYLLSNLLFAEDKLLDLNWDAISRVFGPLAPNELIETLIKKVGEEDLSNLFKIFLISFYYSSSKKNHPFLSLLEFIKKDRSEILIKLFDEEMMKRVELAVPILFPVFSIDSLKYLSLNLQDPELKKMIERKRIDLQAESISDPLSLFFQPEPEFPLIYNRKDFELFQEYALALLYHLRYQSNLLLLKDRLRSLVFHKFISHRIEIILELLVAESEKYKIDYFNYFLIEPELSLEAAIKSIVFTPNLNDENEIKVRLSLVAEIIKHYPDVSIKCLKELFSKAPNLFILSYSIMIKNIFKTHKLSENMNKFISELFKSLLINSNEKYNKDLSNGNAQMDFNSWNPYGISEDCKGTKGCRKYFDTKIYLSFYNTLFLEGKRIFYHFPIEPIPYYVKKIASLDSIFQISRSHVADPSIYNFPNLSIFSGLVDPSFNLIDSISSMEVNENPHALTNIKYGFPITAGEYSIESYFPSFKPRTMQTVVENASKKRTLSFRTNSPTYTQLIYQNIHAPHGYQDLFGNRNTRTQNQQYGEPNWDLNLNEYIRTRFFSEYNERFLMNLRWNSYSTSIDDESDSDALIDISNSGYLSKMSIFCDKHPLYLGENLNFLYLSNTNGEIPSKQDFIVLFNKAIAEFNQLTDRELTIRYHCSKSTFRQIILHQFTLWSKLFGYFKDPTLYLLISTNAFQFSQISLLDIKGRFVLIEKLYEAMFDGEYMGDEIKKMLEQRENELKDVGAVSALGDRETEKEDNQLTDDLLI